MKECSVCGSELKKSAVGRLRIARRKEKGEDIAWICPPCAGRMNFEEREDEK